MTTPNDPNQPPGYGQPASGDPAGGYGAPGYGAPAGGVPAPMGGMPELAGWGSRVGATLLDGLIGAGIIVVALIVGAILGQASKGLGLVVIILGYLAGIAFGFWNNYRMGVTGQTIGKKQLGIFVRKEADGSFVGGGMGIARGFIHVIDGAVCALGYLWPLWDAKKQTFTDKVMGTVVVKG
ncbi:MAG: hypothetical protein QOJ92_922 [Frankiales bacterium]|nr:hypothetical protein [Frankiales bacterium]